MQRILECALTVEQYIEKKMYAQVSPEPICPCCSRLTTLNRHGTYDRGVADRNGNVHETPIARFLCLLCHHTVSYLPSFALTYCLLQGSTFEAFLSDDWSGRDVQTHLELLQVYQRRMTAFGPQLIHMVGYGFGRAPPVVSSSRCTGLWAWLKEACGSIPTATRQLVAMFKITLFNRYQCHQPVGGNNATFRPG
jgi:hypothetical protein